MRASALINAAALALASGAVAAASAVRMSAMSAQHPPMLKATDGPQTFTYDTVSRRLPLIVESVIASNGYTDALAASLQNLADEIRADAPLVPLARAEDARWNEYPLMAAALREGQSWFSAPWWLVENYLYRRILELLRAAGDGRDPFAAPKAQALLASAAPLRETVLPLLGAEGVGVEHYVYRALWGNRADLSISAGDAAAALDAAAVTATARAAGGAAGGGAGACAGPSLESVRDSASLLCDDTARALEVLRAAQGAHVVLVLDNAGLELLADLALAHGLLSAEGGARPCASFVTLHAKPEPVFVSDVTAADVELTLGWLDDHGGGALADATRAHLRAGRLTVDASHHFYISPEPFCSAALPAELRAAYARADLVVLKGDANYRRLLADAAWAHDTPCARVLPPGWPTPTLCLRTCKSEVLVGVAPEQTARAAAAAPDWLTSGRFGVVQLFEPGGAAA